MANRANYSSSMLHTRVRFQPLTWSCVLRCLTEQSPVTQKAYLDLEIAVDRSATPCCILPQLVVNDPDGVMDTGVGNTLLSATAYDSQFGYVRGHEWYVDGVEISSAWEEGTDYEITADTTDEYNGMLTIYKNLSAGEVVTLQYRGVFADSRTASNIVVVSDEMQLECLDAGDEEIIMGAAPSVITYDPLKDVRLLAEYLEGEGYTASYTDDGHTYSRSVQITILQGTTPLEAVPDGYTLGYYLLGTDTEVTEDDDYVESIDGLTITFDLRCMEDTQIEARLIKDSTGLIRCRQTIELIYEPSDIASVKLKSACDLAQSSETYENSVIVNTAKETVEYPECYFDITWRVSDVGEYSAGDEEGDVVDYGEGCSVAVDDIGMDKTTEAGAQFWAEAEVAYKSAYARLTDDDEVLVDDDGNTLIG